LRHCARYAIRPALHPILSHSLDHTPSPASPQGPGPISGLNLGLALILALALVWSLAQPVQAQMETVKKLLPEGVKQSLFGKQPYTMEIRGEMPESVREVLRSVSEVHEMRERAPGSAEMLARRAKGDIADMQRGLRSEGYYAAGVKVRVENPDGKPPVVIFEVDTGPAYILKNVYFDGPAAEGQVDFPPPDAASVGLSLGQRARAPQIEQGAGAFRDYLREHGFPFPWVRLREAIVDHQAHSMTLFYTFNPGPKAVFGPVRVSGEQRVKPEYILKKTPWTEGQVFQASVLTKLRSRLMRDGLFTMVDVSHPDASQWDAAGPDAALPIDVTVMERVPRTVKAGAAYETDSGLNTALEWEHRNFWGKGEQLRTRLDLGEKKQKVRAEYQVPDFWDEHQSLEVEAAFGQEKTDALKTREISTGAKIIRQLNRYWSTSLGVNYRLSEVTQLGVTDRYGLLSTPGELTWDRRDNVLNPTTGWRAQVRAEPFMDTLGLGTWFFKLWGQMSAYLSLLGEDRLVLAGRGALGSITGEANLSLPPDERFYAGGGGSIRGYAYQSIGPEIDGTVVGGRSIVETSMELRLRLPSNFGLVAFLDGGQVFTDPEVRFQDDFRWGAGLGLRYYTDFAPIRLDVAVPLNKRGKDDAFQVYVSIGQAY